MYVSTMDDIIQSSEQTFTELTYATFDAYFSTVNLDRADKFATQQKYYM